jgi:hypothetical protein
MEIVSVLWVVWSALLLGLSLCWVDWQAGSKAKHSSTAKMRLIVGLSLLCLL